MVRAVLLVGCLAAGLAFAGAAPATVSSGDPNILVYSTFVPKHFLTEYVVSFAIDPNTDLFRARDAEATWHLTPPRQDPRCDLFHVKPVHYRSTQRVRKAVSRAVWLHGDQHGCNHRLEGPHGHRGTVTVTVDYKQWHCTASFDGTESDGWRIFPCRQRD